MSFFDPLLVLNFSPAGPRIIRLKYEPVGIYGTTYFYQEAHRHTGAPTELHPPFFFGWHRPLLSYMYCYQHVPRSNIFPLIVAADLYLCILYDRNFWADHTLLLQMTSPSRSSTEHCGKVSVPSTCRSSLVGQDDIEQQQQHQHQQDETADPLLHGLEQAMSHLDHSGAANFTDYLKAQRALQSHRCVQAHPHTHHDGPSAAHPRRSTATAADIAGRSSRTMQAAAAAAPTSEVERKTIKRLSLIGRRSSTANSTGKTRAANTPSDDENWERIFHELEAIDEDGHFHDGTDHMIPWYSPPVQRQRWGQDQILPHINWGDLFFDLFYVAAAYNLGVMLISALNQEDWPRGLIYFIGIFGPLYNTWETATYYESRYTKVDYAHRVFEVVRFLFVSVAVLHIKPLELLSDPKSMEVLTFTLAILMEAIMHLGLNCELYVKGQGDRAAIKNHTLVKMKYQLLPAIFMYLVAVAVAAVQFAQPSAEKSSDYNSRFLASAGADKYDYGVETYPYADEKQQPRWALSDLPLTLTAIAYLLNILHTVWRKMRATSGKHGDIRGRYVPNNIDYMIHRYGEWIMLMIGESVLSLLIVETTESGNYYIITTFGVLTVILLQILKFESEPSHAEAHALWGNLRNSMMYGYLIQILSMGLIAFGVSFKVFLQAVVKSEGKESDYGYDTESPKSRMLAPAVEVSDEATAALFTGSLSVVLISLELMLLTHNGVKKAFGRLFHESKDDENSEDERGDLNIPMVVIALVKLGIILFTLTLNQWTTHPAILTLCGFAIVTTMALTRVLGWAFVHHREKIDNAAKTFANTARNFTKTVSFGPQISASGEKALESSEASKFFTAPSDVGDGDGDKSESASITTKGTDTISGGIEDSFDAIVVADLKGTIKQVNTTTLDVFGYESKEEVVGKDLAILVGGGEGKNHDAYMKRFRGKDGKKSSKILGQQRMLHARRADGTEFPCLIGIKTCAGGTRIAGYIRDMSTVVADEKEKMVANMKVKEALDRVVDDHAFDAIIASDSDGIIHRVNETAVAEFGYDNKDDLVGQNISTLIRSVRGHPERLLESHGEQHVVTLTRKDGLEFQSIIATTKIRDADDMVASYIRNIDPIKSMTCIRCKNCDD